MRDDELISLLTEVSSFCTTYDIPILNMDEIFVISERPWHNTQQKVEARSIIRSILSFEFVFVLHLMKNFLGITNELSIALQNK